MNQKTQNIDPSEIAKFEALASRWWDKNGEMKSLHDINPLRANYIDSRAKVAGKKLLDVGCGAGLLSEAMAQRGADVSAIDMSGEALNIAKLHLFESELTINYQQSTAEDFAQDNQACFDVVTCMEMLEHVPEPDSVIKACADMVKPGGDIFFSTINRNSKAFGFAIVAAEHILNLVPKGTHHYDKLIKPSELAKWMRQSGLVLKNISGMQYNPITKKYSLDDNADVNYLVHAVKAK
jgi:2-polyprenyl-6-hydroxyphenyl methylase/3-demethylubiquinone-9 3-methyltransferase